jgi:hypothetical protein
VSGAGLSGRWTEAPARQPPDAAGEFAFTMTDDCQSFTSRWRYGTSDAWHTDWTGHRVATPRP